LEARFVLHENGSRFPRQIPECTEQNDRLYVAVPIGGGVELHLDVTQTVSQQDQDLVTERTRDLDGSVDIAPHVKEVIGIDPVVVLPRVDRERSISLGRDPWTKSALRRSPVASSAPVDHDNQRRIRGLLGIRLP
jgi:hypothetical protein